MSTTAADRARALSETLVGTSFWLVNGLLDNLHKECPEFSAGGKDTKKGQPYHHVQREYDAVRKHLNEMEKKALSVPSQGAVPGEEGESSQ